MYISQHIYTYIQGIDAGPLSTISPLNRYELSLPGSPLKGLRVRNQKTLILKSGMRHRKQLKTI